MVYLMVLALIVVFPLAVYAFKLHGELKRVDAEREAVRLELESQQKAKAAEVEKSIVILAKAFLGDELSVTEACLRISWLLSQLDPQAKDTEAYSVFYQVADSTSHIPILEEWKALSREQRKAFDRERGEIEKAFEDFVLVATKQLLENGVPKPSQADKGQYYSA